MSINSDARVFCEYCQFEIQGIDNIDPALIYICTLCVVSLSEEVDENAASSEDD